jgi:hypothetical protein
MLGIKPNFKSHTIPFVKHLANQLPYTSSTAYSLHDTYAGLFRFQAVLYGPVLYTGLSGLLRSVLMTGAMSILLSHVPETTHLTLPSLSITKPFT